MGPFIYSGFQLGAATSSPLRNLDTYLQGQPSIVIWLENAIGICFLKQEM